jgi:hypothetical protein
MDKCIAILLELTTIKIIVNKNSKEKEISNNMKELSVSIENGAEI